jgi:hypothetical protein
VRVLYAPGSTFEEQREKPTWFLPWLIIAIVCVGIGFWQLPYTQRVIELALASRPNPPQVSPSVLRTQAMFGVVVTPVFFLIAALVGAGILFLLVSIAGSSARFRGLLSATVFAQVLVPITLILQGIILRMRGAPADAISTMADAQPALGLNLLVSPESTGRFVGALLAGIGPLPIWSLFITAIGIMRLEGVKKSTAWTAAIGSYVVLLLVGAGLASLQR